MTTGSDERPGDNQQLEDLVFELLERAESEGAGVLVEMCSAHPTLASRLKSRVEMLQRAGLLAGGSESAPLPDKLGDFDILERLGGGGMGVVFRARQRSLGREVALKLIRPENLWFGDARERFRREVEATARLQHPGIVPIYAVGEERGVPYFAMELVAGASLSDVLEALRGRNFARLTGTDLLGALAGEGTSELFDGTWWQCIVRIVREVAEALEHTHRRGVLHRDIKPSNIMVTRSGRVMLVDFGLAASQGADRLTRSGSQIGSLPYLSPEQIKGGVAAADAASDVYSLGVTLYELLTGELPFRADDAPRLLQSIAEGRPAPPRRSNPALPADLEIVCLTACEGDRDRRYATADDFARDLSNVLARLPIDARAAGPVRKLVRWTQRKPAHATASALAALLLVGTPTALWLTQRTANAREKTANNLLRQQRDRAETSLDVAGRAIDRLLSRVGHDSLADVPRLEAVRRQLLDDARAFSEELAHVDPDQEGAQERSAVALLRLSQIEEMLGHPEKALEQADQSIALLRRSDSPSAHEKMSAALQARARSLRGLQRNEDALAAADEAAASYVPASSADVSHAERRRRVVLESFRSQLAFYLGRVEQGIAHQRATIAEQRTVVQLEPNDDERSHLADLLSTLGYELGEQGKLESSQDALVESAALAEDCLTRDALSRELRASLASTSLSLGAVIGRMRRPAEAVPHFRRAVALYTELVRDFPATPDYSLQLDSSRQSLAAALGQQPEGRQEAGQLLREAIANLETLCATRDTTARCRGRLAVAIGNLGAFLLPEDPAQALALFHRAVDEMQPMIDAEPGNPEWRSSSGEWLAWIAFTHGKRGEIQQAVDVLERSSEMLPREWPARRSVAGRWSGFAKLVDKTKGLEPDVRATLRAKCVQFGLAALREASDAGYVDLADMRGSRELEALRADPGWAELTHLIEQRVAQQLK